MTAYAAIYSQQSVHRKRPLLTWEKEDLSRKHCEKVDPWPADLTFRIRAGLLASFIAAVLFPVSQ